MSEAERTAAIAEWKHLTEQVLPALAQQHRWPVRLDHCFKRLTLDYAFQDVWYRHLAKPAEQHLEGDALHRALNCAQSIAQQGEATLRVLNEQSLRYRGKGLRGARQRS